MVRLMALLILSLSFSSAAFAQDAIRVVAPSNVATCRAEFLDLTAQISAASDNLSTCELRIRGPNAHQPPFELAFTIVPTYPQVQARQLDLRFIIRSTTGSALRGFTIAMPPNVSSSGLGAEITRRKGNLPTLNTKGVDEIWEYALWAYLVRNSTTGGAELTSNAERKRDLDNIRRHACQLLRDNETTAAAMYHSLNAGVLPMCAGTTGSPIGVLRGFETNAAEISNSRGPDAPIAALRLRQEVDAFQVESGIDRSLLNSVLSTTDAVIARNPALLQGAPTQVIAPQHTSPNGG